MFCRATHVFAWLRGSPGGIWVARGADGLHLSPFLHILDIAKLVRDRGKRARRHPAPTETVVMPMHLDLPAADDLLLTRRDLHRRGTGDRELAALRERGELVRVRRGWYISDAHWRELWPESRHLLHVLAVSHDAARTQPVFSHTSAAALWGLPLYQVRPQRVHVYQEPRVHARSMPDVLRHEGRPSDEDITEVAGIRVTTLERTVLDLARTLSPEAALAQADAALRGFAVTGQEQDEQKAAFWRADLGERARRSGSRGSRQAREIIAFSDGRAQLPGESVSRLQLHRLGFRVAELQVPVHVDEQTTYWIDFDLGDVGAWGEFDGTAKYLDPTLRGGRTAEQTVLAEKHREDMIRGITGRRIVRWGSSDILTPERLRDRLARFGISPRRR